MHVKTIIKGNVDRIAGSKHPPGRAEEGVSSYNFWTVHVAQQLPEQLLSHLLTFTNLLISIVLNKYNLIKNTYFT